MKEPMKNLITTFITLLLAVPSFSQTMEWHIKDNYVDIKYMGNNLFKVKNSSGKWGIVNEYGEISVELRYDSITPIVENRALLLDVTGIFLKGIVNENGQLIKSFHNGERLANYQFYKEGMLAYGIISGGDYYNFGYLDLQGNTRIAPKYFWAAPFNGGKAVVQYKSGNYGLINNGGTPILRDNRKFKYISSPVSNQLLIAYSSSRGDKVALCELKGNGKLDEIEEFQSGTIVQCGNDYKSLSCQNGSSYYFDDAMRLLSSSTGKKYNSPLRIGNVAYSSNAFSKKRGQGGWQILYGGKTVMSTSFSNVSFCDDEYAIVTTSRNTLGVLKINSNGSVNIQDVPQQAYFYHNTKEKGNIAVNIEGLMSSSQVQLGIIGLDENNVEEKHNIPAGYNGVYNLPIYYFIPADRYESAVSLPIKVNLYINGVLYNTSEQELSGIHKRGFSISDANAPDFSEPDGSATITFSVRSLESSPSSSAKVRVSGSADVVRSFSGDDTAYFRIPVKVPFASQKVYTFTVTVSEDGCPSYTRTISRTIKHYNLQ